MVAKRRVAVLVSGRGSNMVALHEASQDPDYPAEIVGVASDRSDAAALGIATERGLAAKVVGRKDFADKVAHEAALVRTLEGWAPDYVCLAGYMRILSADFLGRWPGPVLNIHPSLLPSFPGLDTHRRALDGGVRIHGCTVHFVTPGVDEGPIVAQAAVPVLADDDEEALSRRVLREEHRLYPQALADVASGAARLVGGRVVRRGSSGAVLASE